VETSIKSVLNNKLEPNEFNVPPNNTASCSGSLGTKKPDKDVVLPHILHSTDAAGEKGGGSVGPKGRRSAVQGREWWLPMDLHFSAWLNLGGVWEPESKRGRILPGEMQKHRG